MEKKVFVVCIFVGILGLISAVSGFAAEFRRIKASQVNVVYLDDHWKCVYPSSPSPALGFGAAMALILARIILSVAGGWCCCCRRDSNISVSISCTARLCSIFSWLTSVLALFMLLGGATFALRQGGTIRNDGRYGCYYVKPGIFAGGAIMAFASVVLGTISYFIFSSAKNKAIRSDSEKPPAFPLQNPTASWK